ncbi:hypothetical protein ABVT39_022556 [Epinephelus coioides]
MSTFDPTPTYGSKRSRGRRRSKVMRKVSVSWRTPHIGPKCLVKGLFSEVEVSATRRARNYIHKFSARNERDREKRQSGMHAARY